MHLYHPFELLVLHPNKQASDSHTNTSTPHQASREDQQGSSRGATLQDSQLGFTIDIPIIGEIALGLWLDDHKGEWDPPQLACSFHTVFDGCGLLRMVPDDLDLPAGSLLDAAVLKAADFFVDVTVVEQGSPLNPAQYAPKTANTLLLHYCEVSKQQQTKLVLATEKLPPF